jgi:acyl-CoA reductase-like NAD-dependent aldehyde dehydrogenase
MRWPMPIHSGAFVEGDLVGAPSLEVQSPFDGRVAGRVAVADEALLERAVAASVRAAPALARTSRAARAESLERVASLLEAHREPLAALLSEETGKPIVYAELEVARAADTLRASADAARGLVGEEVPLDAARAGEGRLGFVRRFPVGPVLGVTPWNFPLNLVAHKVGPAYAAGCPLVLKPASKTPLSALALAELCREAGFVDGALAVVPCSRALGQRLVEDARFHALSFTGSAEVGWQMKRDAGKKRALLELGGNAAAVVLDDADLEHAAKRIAVGAYYQAGQSCISVQRVIVTEAVYEAFRERLVDEVRRLPFGDPRARATVCGPVIDAASAARVEAWIEEALSLGARALVSGPREGNVLAPTLLEGAPSEARVVREEVFGPVACLERAEDEADALRRAGDTRFGLQCGVFTRDVRALFRAWSELDVGGLVHDDAPAFRVDLMPYGGRRDSGLGREGPRYAVSELTEPRLLIVRA